MEMRKTHKYIIYHHDDPDGHVAGAVIYNHLISQNVNKNDIFTFAKNYNDEFLEHKAYMDTNGESNDLIVYIVDLSFTPNTINKLYTICNDACKVYWFDHHKSSESIVNNHEYLDAIAQTNCKFYKIFSTNVCGAILAHIYSYTHTYTLDALYSILDENGPTDIQFSHNNDDVIIKVPHESEYVHVLIYKFLYHIDAYDRWTKKDPDADAFICGIKASNYGYTINYNNMQSANGLYRTINMCDDDFVNDIVVVGRHALNYYMNLMKEQSEYIGIWEIGKYKIAYKNAVGQSWNFNDLIDSKQVDAGLIGYYDPKYDLWKYSIYSYHGSEVQANKIAEKFGGGGHPGAAGFSSKICFFNPDNHWSNYNETTKDIWEVLGQSLGYSVGNDHPIDKMEIDESDTRIWLDGNKDNRWRNLLKQYLNPSMYVDSMHTTLTMEDMKYHLFVFIPNTSATNHYQKIFDRLMKYVINHASDKDIETKVKVFIINNDTEYNCNWDIVDANYNSDPSMSDILQAVITFCNAHNVDIKQCKDVDSLVFKLGGYIASVIKDMSNNK